MNRVKDLKPGEYKIILNDFGNSWYATPCADCGREVKTWSCKDGVKVRCRSCKAIGKENAKSETVKQITELKRLRHIEIAEEIICKKYKTTKGYEQAFEKVKEKIKEHPGWFQSSNEILTAVELLRTNTIARPQVKLGRWRADFVLDDLKVVLEIDGYQHETKQCKEKDGLKDAAIIAGLGPEWEIIRIKEELIKQNLKKLIPAINAVVNTRKKLREAHNGRLPSYYSEVI